jgi:hypothetical protein
MGTSEYVVLFVAVVYFLGGYALGRVHDRGPKWVSGVDPDPIPTREEEGLAEVIPLRRMRPAASRNRESAAARSGVH